eukprot:scaffold1875_cov339-Prasinococcus_capsulatus_cf.AAC.15
MPVAAAAADEAQSSDGVAAELPARTVGSVGVAPGSVVGTGAAAAAAVPAAVARSWKGTP